MVKKMVTFVLPIVAMVAWALFPNVVRADVEWKVLKSLDLKAAPLDVAPSMDGQRLFVLTAGEILVYSIPEGKITDHIPVDKEFDRIVAVPRGDTLSVSSSKKKMLQVIMLESIYKIDVSGLPFKGPKDAPVTIAVYDDYQ
ncbi:MAG TPA: hypothetical protein VKF36_02810 [Syntrophorhabdales bacterium]|nr:hypothetical protein [Syntrophorhabdales bacterium]